MQEVQHLSELDRFPLLRVNCLRHVIVLPPDRVMRFSRNQIIGTLILITLLWAVLLYRMLFSRA